MPAQRANQRALAASRILENLSYALPLYFDDLLACINHTIGHTDHTPGAAPATIQPASALSGICGQPTTLPDLLDTLRQRVTILEYRLQETADTDEVIDCTLDRPCPTHDYPITLNLPEGAAHQREQWRAEHADAQQVITTITILANDLLARARRTVPLEPLPMPRCDATGMDGYLIPRPPHSDGWSDLSCTKPRSRGTLCEACSQREYRWRKAHDMTPRPDGVSAHPKGDAVDVAEYARYGLRREP